MKILVACEESQIVTTAFRKKGHEAYSCDIIDTSGNHPEWHIKDDVINHLNNNWDLIIAFPPCTDLSNAQSGPIMDEKIKQGKPQAALEFIKKIWESCERVVIENPKSSYLNRNWLPYTQVIQPYYFGHDYIKTTCLWMKNVPFLISTCYANPKYKLVAASNKKNPQSTQKRKGLYKDAKNRSKFHPYVAEAMADQWNNLI